MQCVHYGGLSVQILITCRVRILCEPCFVVGGRFVLERDFIDIMMGEISCVGMVRVAYCVEGYYGYAGVCYRLVGSMADEGCYFA